MSSLELVLNKLAKWRSVFAGWQLGTRLKGDPEGDAVRDHREATILLRAEVTALVTVLVQRGVITLQDWKQTLEAEAAHLDRAYEERFPGFQTTQNGVEINLKRAVETTKGWKP